MTLDLLREEKVKPMGDGPQRQQLRSASENEFFYLTFSQYVGLNQKPDVKLPTLLEIVRSKDKYEAFRDELSRAPVSHEDDAILLAGLKERMDAIEKMRNCVAHNRRPSSKVTENYENARPLIDELLDGYLAQWEMWAAEEPATGDEGQVAASPAAATAAALIGEAAGDNRGGDDPPADVVEEEPATASSGGEAETEVSPEDEAVAEADPEDQEPADEGANDGR